MGLMDCRNVPVSTNSRASLDGFERALTLLNGYFLDPLATINEVLERDPEFVLGHCFRASLMLASTERGAEPELRCSVEAAEQLAPAANARELGHIAALRAWLDGDFQRASELYGALLVEYPRDLFALQIAHQCDFFLGQSMMLRDRIARVLPYWSKDVPGYGYVLGMYAFGLEEMGDYRRAEDTGCRALAIERRDPWAVHAVAHVMEMEGRVADGIAFLTQRREDWAPGNMFAYHNWWHLGLYPLDLGQTDRVLELYDTAIRPRPSSVALEMVDASAILWRLRCGGGGDALERDRAVLGAGRRGCLLRLQRRARDHGLRRRGPVRRCRARHRGAGAPRQRPRHQRDDDARCRAAAVPGAEGLRRGALCGRGRASAAAAADRTPLRRQPRAARREGSP